MSAKRDYSAQKRWSQRNRQRVRMTTQAAHKVFIATVTGVLVRPFRCSQCSERRPIEAAHDDYNQPLKVRWLCRPCHRKWDHDDPKTLSADQLRPADEAEAVA